MSFTEEQKDELIRQALLSTEGRVKLGEAMGKPRRSLDHNGKGRILVVDPLPQAELPIYDRDIDCSAVVVKQITIPARGYWEGQIEEWLKEQR